MSNVCQGITVIGALVLFVSSSHAQAVLQNTADTRHDGAVTAVAFSHDGKLLATGSADLTVKLWDVATGKLQATLEGHSWHVESLAFLPGSKILVSAGSSAVQFWDVATHKKIDKLEASLASVRVLAVRPEDDGKIAKILATGNEDGDIRLWDLDKKETVRTLKRQPKAIVVLAYRPDGKVLASLAKDSTVVEFWDDKSGDNIGALPAHPQTVTAFAWASEGTMSVTGCADGFVRLWPGKNAAPVILKGPTSTPYAVAFSPDGTLVAAAGANGQVWVWDLKTRHYTAVFRGQTKAVRALAFSPDSSLVVSGGEEKSARLWGVARWKNTLTLDGHQQPIMAVALSGDGKTIASADLNGHIKFWERATGKKLAEHQPYEGGDNHFALHPDGNTLASTGRVGTGRMQSPLILWDMATGQKTKPLVHFGSDMLAYSPDGKTLAAVGNTGILLCESKKGKKTRELLHKSSCRLLAWSNDSKTIAFVGTDKFVGVYDAETGKAGKSWTVVGQTITSIAFSPDGKHLVAAMYGTPSGSSTLSNHIRIWETETGKETPELPFDRGGYVWRITFSASGKLLCTTESGYGVRLWDWATRSPVALLPSGPKGSLERVTISADEMTVVTGGTDTKVRVWQRVAPAGP